MVSMTARADKGYREDGRVRTRAGVREMFALIAGGYDRMNRVLSWNGDKVWRRRAAAGLRLQAGERVADLCCGTGDMAAAMWGEQEKLAEVTGVDFSGEMLALARAKGERDGWGEKTQWVEAAVEEAVLEGGRYDVVTCVFGLRNLERPEAGLREAGRLLKAGGRLGVLEFGKGRGMWGKGADWYVGRVLPWLGRVLMGKEGGRAYEHLSASIAGFYGEEDWRRELEAAGFEEIEQETWQAGVVRWVRARKAGGERAGQEVTR